MYRIMIVEDDESIRNELEVLLKNALYEPVCVTDFDNLPEQILKEDPDLVLLQKKNGIDLKRYMGLDEAAYDGVLYYKAESPMAVEELLIIKAKDQDQAADLEESMEEHIKSQKKSFEGYGAEQTALLNEAIVETKGNYGLMAVGEKAGAWKERFNDFIS